MHTTLPQTNLTFIKIFIVMVLTASASTVFASAGPRSLQDLLEGPYRVNQPGLGNLIRSLDDERKYNCNDSRVIDPSLEQAVPHTTQRLSAIFDRLLPEVVNPYTSPAASLEILDVMKTFKERVCSTPPHSAAHLQWLRASLSSLGHLADQANVGTDIDRDLIKKQFEQANAMCPYSYDSDLLCHTKIPKPRYKQSSNGFLLLLGLVVVSGIAYLIHCATQTAD